MGLLNGHRSGSWDAIFDRRPSRYPRRENPHPYDPTYGGEADDEDCPGLTLADGDGRPPRPDPGPMDAIFSFTRSW